MQTSKEGVRNHELITVDISTIKFDETNPNELTKEQMHGLRISMQTYGYLTPIIIDQNNMIVDGEHRVLVYKEFDIQKIPAYRLQLDTDTDRKLLRQTMNKLRGEHNFEKDVNEIIQIMQAGKTQELSTLIAQSQTSLEYLQKRFEEQNDKILKALSNEEIQTTNECPKCGYKW